MDQSSNNRSAPWVLADTNLALIVGHLSSDPVERVLPSGTLLTTYEVTVSHHAAPADTVPVVLFDKKGPSRLLAGSGVLVVGRVRRRFFRSGGATISRTEVVAERVVSRGRRAAVRRELERVASLVAVSPSHSPEVDAAPDAAPSPLAEAAS